MSFVDALLLGFAMVLVIEGLAYALFPDGAKRMMEVVREVPSDTLRKGGVLALAAGVVGVWLILA